MGANGPPVSDYNYYSLEFPLPPTSKMRFGISRTFHGNIATQLFKFLATFSVVSAVANSSFSPGTNNVNMTNFSAVASHPDFGALFPWGTPVNASAFKIVKKFQFDGYNVLIACRKNLAPASDKEDHIKGYTDSHNGSSFPLASEGAEPVLYEIREEDLPSLPVELVKKLVTAIIQISPFLKEGWPELEEVLKEKKEYIDEFLS